MEYNAEYLKSQEYNKKDLQRVRRIAILIELQQEVEGYYYKSYEDFLDSASNAIGCSITTVRRLLKRLGLWHGGRKGKKGGRGLVQMQREICRFYDAVRAGEDNE